MIINILVWIGGIAIYYIMTYLAREMINLFFEYERGPNQLFISFVLGAITIPLAIILFFMYPFKTIIDIKKRLKKLEVSQNRRRVKK